MDRADMSSVGCTTSYGYPSYVSGEEYTFALRFAQIADVYLGRPSSDQSSDSSMPPHLATFRDDLEELKAYGEGLLVELQCQHQHALQSRQVAQMLRETADRIVLVLRNKDDDCDDLYDVTSIGAMSMTQESLLRHCLSVYVQHEQVAAALVSVQEAQRTSRAQLEETVIHLWKDRAGIRAHLPEGRRLPETFMQLCARLGFAAKRLPETGLWNYVVLGGATLPAMYERALFLEECCGNGLVPENLILLASGRGVNLEVDCVQRLGFPLDGCKTEADLAERLRQHFVANSGHDSLRRVWSNAVVCRTRTERAGFVQTLTTWLDTAPRPGSVLVVSEQPFLSRLQVQLWRCLHASPFWRERAEVIGAELSEVQQTTRSNVLLDEIAHWVQIQRENA